MDIVVISESGNTYSFRKVSNWRWSGEDMIYIYRTPELEIDSRDGDFLVAQFARPKIVMLQEDWDKLHASA